MGHGPSGGSRHGARVVRRGRAPPSRPIGATRERTAATPPRGRSNPPDRRGRGLERWSPGHRPRARRRARPGRPLRAGPVGHDPRHPIRRLGMTDTMRRNLHQYLLVGVAIALASVLLPHVAFAASAGGGASMPWTGPLQSLLNNLSGPTARIIGALAFVVGGALWAFTRHEEGAKRFGQAIVGIAIMIGAANIVSALAFVGATV